MNDQLKRLPIVLALTAAIGGVLALYRNAVEVLPTHMYSPKAAEFLTLNETRKISQQALTWNLLSSAYAGAPMSFPGQESCVVATLHARYQDFENITVTVYELDFHGEYTLKHTGPESVPLEVFFPFPSNLQTLHEVTFLVDGNEPEDVSYGLEGIRWLSTLDPGDSHRIVVRYKANGASSFTYALQQGIRANVDVKILIDGLAGSQAPSTSLPASSVDKEGSAEAFTWAYESLIPDRDIQVLLPSRDDMTQRLLRIQGDFRDLAAAAPLLVVLFIVFLAVVFHLSRTGLRLEGYLLAGLAAALFFPALTFLAAILPLVAAFALAFSAVTALVLSFLAAIAGMGRTWWRGGLVSVACLGFLPSGLLTPWRGLSASVGGIILVGILMLLFARRSHLMHLQPPTGPPGDMEPAIPQVPDPSASTGGSTATANSPMNLHCPTCSHILDSDYAYCPGCGQDAHRILHCPECGYAQIRTADPQSRFCLSCGRAMNADKNDRL